MTNEHSEPIRGGTIQSFDFSVGVALSGDDTKDAGDLSLRVTVDADDAHVLYAGLEAGGSAIFRLSGNQYKPTLPIEFANVSCQIKKNL